jgi:ribosome-associated heat shock protein Hsp15
MRIDDFLSTVGIIKRRSMAKEIADHGLVEVNGRRVKPSYDVRINDIIVIKGIHPIKIEVIKLPPGSVAKATRMEYYRSL